MTDASPPRPLALVTGGTRRVGRAISLALARAGFDLLVTTRTDDHDARSLIDALTDGHARCDCAHVDLSDPDATDRFARDLARRLDRLDALVHNAAIYAPTPLPSLTSHDALRFFTVNTLAPLLLSARLAPKLAESNRPGGGAIVALADMHALGRPRRGFVAYNLSKAALVELVRSLARELAPRVRVNAIAPGVVAFPQVGPDADPRRQQAYIARVPLQRAGTPAEAAEVVRWLIVDATYLTGEIVRVDGGRWLA